VENADFNTFKHFPLFGTLLANGFVSRNEEDHENDINQHQ
jgi:hypothetical protein